MLVIMRSRNAEINSYQKGLAEGFAKYNVQSKFMQLGTPTKYKYVACWGWRPGSRLRLLGKEVLIMERGYIGDRFKYTSLSWNGLNGYGDFPEYLDETGERFYKHGGSIKPWREGGDYALIMGQVPNDASLRGKNLIPWYERQAAEITRIYNIPVYFRPHPDCAKRGIHQVVKGTIRSSGTLQEAFAGAAFTVCYNSNSSVDSVLAGVPCVVGDRGSMAYNMCSKQIGELIRPERERWAYSLAWKQWEESEIYSGEAVKGLLWKLGL